MAGVTGKAQIDQATRTFLAASRYTLQERPGVVWSSIRHEDLPKQQGPSVNIPKYGQVSTFALTEGVDMAQSQQITDTLMTLTPAEYGTQVFLTDLMLMTVKDEFMRVAGRIQADSFDRQREQTLCDDASNFSVTNGAAAAACTVGHVMANHATIKGAAQADGTSGRGGEPGPDPVCGIVTPAIAHDIKKTMVGGIGAAGNTQNAPDFSKGGKQYGQFMVDEVSIKTTVNLTKDTNDDVVCPFLSKEAWIGVTLGGGPSAENERDASMRGWEINYVGRWARGEYNDSWGVASTHDSAKPTS